MTLPDAKDCLGEDSSRPLVYNNETERAILEQTETQKKSSLYLRRGFHAQQTQTLPSRPRKKGGRPPLEWETMFMWTTKVLIQHGIPRKADELIERMREACRTAGIEVPAVSTLEPTAFKWMQILREEFK